MENWVLDLFYNLNSYHFLFVCNKNSLEVSLAFTKIAKIQTEKDLKIVSEIVNNSALTKTEILDEIERDKFYKLKK
jgi:hypothetical protein